MARATVDESEFLKLWHQIGSPQRLAEHLGVTVRAVYERRSRIEKARGFALPAFSEKAIKHDTQSVKLVTSSRREANRFEITDGVILVGSDAHYSPGHVSVAHKALCNLLADMGTDVKAVVLNGDILDGGSISRHPALGFQKVPTVKEELEAVQERLGDIERVRPAGCKLLRTYGNHCNRWELRLANQAGQTWAGVQGMLLRDHIPHWEDSLRIDVNEDMVIIHDWHSGVHSGWNDVVKGGCHTVTGHTHELSAKAHKGFKNTHYGIKTGMLADEFQSEFDYRLGKPGFNWQSGFAVLTWKDGMLLHPEFCAVRDNGSAYFRGKLYGTP